MSATTTVTGTPDKPPIVGAPRRGSLLKRLASPYRPGLRTPDQA